jgi:hypothetical protein
MALGYNARRVPAVFVGVSCLVATEGPREDRCDAVVFIFFIDG